MEVACLLHPFRRDDAEGLHGDGGVLAFACPQLGLVRLEGRHVVPIPLGLGPGESVTGLGTLSNTGTSDLVGALGMVGQTAQLGDGLDLVDADGSLEHGPRIARQGRIVI